MKGKNRKGYRMMKGILIGIGLALFFMSIIIPSGVILAKGKYKPEWVMPEHYPDGFDGWGRIDRIGKNELVIGDRSLPFAENVEYHTPTASDVSIAYFNSGDLVGYVLNPKRQIVSLWLIVME